MCRGTKRFTFVGSVLIADHYVHMIGIFLCILVFLALSGQRWALGGGIGSEIGFYPSNNSLYVTIHSDKGVLNSKSWGSDNLRRPFHLLRDIQDLLLGSLEREFGEGAFMKTWVETCGLLVNHLPAVEANHVHIRSFRSFIRAYLTGLFFHLQRQMISERVDFDRSSTFVLDVMRTKDYRPRPLYNLSVIVPLSSLDTGLSGRGTSYGLWRWLDEFREELVFSTIHVAAPIRVVVAYITDRREGQPDSDTQRGLFDGLCTSINDFFLEIVPDAVNTDGVTVQCVFFESHEQADVREIAARFAYETWNTDFYLLADTRFPWTSPGWTSRLLWHVSWKTLTETSVVAFPVVLYGQHPFVNAPLQHPLSPLLSRSFFAMFAPEHFMERRSRSDGHVNIFFLQSTSFVWNNVFLHDALRTFDCVAFLSSDEHEDFALGAPRDGDETSLLHEIALYPVDGVRLVLAARQHIWRWLNRHVFARNPIVWRAAANDSISPRDKLYPYCRLTSACPEASLSDEQTPLLFWQETLHLPRTFICKFAEVHARLWASISVDTGVLCRDDEAVEDQTVIHKTFNSYFPSELYEQRGAKVAVITAVFGDYELTGKPFPRQTMPTDFVLFTDRPLENITAPGWIIVNTPYHVLQFQEEMELAEAREQHNALHRHTHPFNVAKFYKQSFHKIPMLQKYDVVIWVDGTVVITDPSMSQRMVQLLAEAAPQRVMAVFEHHRRGQLAREVNASTVSVAVSKYRSEFWGGYAAVIQDVTGQYDSYLKEGYRSPHHPERVEYGLWCTCFVAWNMRSNRTASVLDMWYRHTLQYTTQDQVSFPVVLQRLNVGPVSLPDGRVDVYGTFTANTMFFKYYHGF